MSRDLFVEHHVKYVVRPALDDAMADNLKLSSPREVRIREEGNILHFVVFNYGLRPPFSELSMRFEITASEGADFHVLLTTYRWNGDDWVVHPSLCKRFPEIDRDLIYEDVSCTWNNARTEALIYRNEAGADPSADRLHVASLFDFLNC